MCVLPHLAAGAALVAYRRIKSKHSWQPERSFPQKKKGHYVTRGSREIPHRSTNLAQCRLASGIGRDLAFSAWYERSIPETLYAYIRRLKS